MDNKKQPTQGINNIAFGVEVLLATARNCVRAGRHKYNRSTYINSLMAASKIYGWNVGPDAKELLGATFDIATQHVTE